MGEYWTVGWATRVHFPSLTDNERLFKSMIVIVP